MIVGGQAHSHNGPNMTPVGHTLTGFAIASLAMPAGLRPRTKLGVYATMAVLANAPDAPFSWWGHARYDISHSVFVTAGVVTVLMVLGHYAFGRLPKSLLMGGALAWFSHLLLDTFYNHGKGLAMFWPVSDARVALPVPWFETMSTSELWGMHNLRVFAVEGVVFGVVWLVAIFVGLRKSRNSAELAG